MSQGKEKVKYLLPGDKPPLETTTKTVNLGASALICIATFFISTSVYFLILWKVPFNFTNTNLPPLTHLFGFWRVVMPFEFISLGDYGEEVYRFRQNELWFWVVVRYLTALFFGAITSIFALIYSLSPTGGDKHIKGKLLLRGKESYNDLKREFSFLSKDGRGSGLVVAADKKFDPSTQILDDLKNGTYIELPEKLRRSHFMFLGGTGRGKTQLIYYRLVAQLYGQIRKGKKVKLLIADTPKSDYARYFYSKHVFSICPAEAGGVAWDISKDLTDALLANAFWKGKIPSNDSDSIWPNAAITLGTGCTKFLQDVAPKVWNYGMLAHILTKNGDELEPLLNEHYPESKQILGAAGETLSSVMFNLGTYTTDIISLARIYDGFDIKKSVMQATADALKHEAYLNYMCKDLAMSDMVEGEEGEIMTRSIMLKGSCRYLNSINDSWKWVDVAKFVQLPKIEQVNLVKTFLSEDDYKVVNKMPFHKKWMHLASTIIHYASKWDELESENRLSIRDWVINENPNRKILLLKPSETYPTLTEGLIKGILYYVNSIILGRLQDDRNRKFHILIDEFQSYGNIEPFISPALSLYRSRGVSITIAFQDLAQLVKIYGQELVDFMNSNIGNINILGVNDGFTANKLSELLGEKKIQKLHRSRSTEGSGSEDYQEHDEKVIYANEWNLLGANDAIMNIKYLSLTAGLNPAYILDAPIIPYKTRHQVKPASWIDAPPPEKPVLQNLQELWNAGTKPSIVKEEPIDEIKSILEKKKMMQSQSKESHPISETIREAFTSKIVLNKSIEDIEYEINEMTSAIDEISSNHNK